MVNCDLCSGRVLWQEEVLVPFSFLILHVGTMVWRLPIVFNVCGCWIMCLFLIENFDLINLELHVLFP